MFNCRGTACCALFRAAPAAYSIKSYHFKKRALKMTQAFRFFSFLSCTLFAVRCRLNGQNEQKPKLHHFCTFGRIRISSHTIHGISLAQLSTVQLRPCPLPKCLFLRVIRIIRNIKCPLPYGRVSFFPLVFGLRIS